MQNLSCVIQKFMNFNLKIATLLNTNLQTEDIGVHLTVRD